MESRLETVVKKHILESILLSDDIENKLENKKYIIFGIIPDLGAEEEFDQKYPHHCYDAWEHTVKALSYSKPDLEIRTALLLHDIAKPYCYQQDYEHLYFSGHQEKGAEMAEKILADLEFSKKEIDDICYLIKNHDKRIDVNNLNDINIELIEKLLQVQYCDTYAHHPDYIEKNIKELDETKKRIEEYKEQKNRESKNNKTEEIER